MTLKTSVSNTASSFETKEKERRWLKTQLLLELLQEIMYVLVSGHQPLIVVIEVKTISGEVGLV